MSRPATALLTALLTLSASVALHAAGPTAGLSPAGPTDAKPPFVTPPPPDPDLILQGGDTCATATVIPGIPYSDTGTTDGYTNDYDEVCPYTGSTSPDVVYAYTPAADIVVDVTLCVGTTDYDTKLYVYEGTCAAPNFACNDDACSSPLTSWVSALSALALTGGQTYYFVVDGYGGASGDYTIELTEAAPLPTCDMADVVYGQDPDGPSAAWSASTSGQATGFDYTAAESFDGTNMSIEGLHFWGLSAFWGEGWMPCTTPGAMTFDVRFYADNAGVPGTEICSYAGVSPTMTDTGLTYNGEFALYSWDLPSLAPACLPSAGTTWVTVKSLLHPDDCTFLWMSGTGGDAASLQYDTGAWAPQAYDLAMCLTGTIVPVELQSFSAE